MARKRPNARPWMAGPWSHPFEVFRQGWHGAISSARRSRLPPLLQKAKGIAWALALSALFVASPASADKKSDAERELAALRARIQALAEEQRASERERGDASKELREADGEVAKATRALRATEAALAAQQTELDAALAQQATLEQGLAKQRRALAALLRSRYLRGEQSQLQLLLEQEKIGELARALAYHRYFERDRAQRMAALRTELAALAVVVEQVQAKQATLEQARIAQAAAVAALDQQRQAQRKAVATLDQRYRDRKARLAALGRDEKATEKLLRRLRAAMEQTRRAPKVAPAQRKAGDAKVPVGSLALPLTGQVLAGFGGVMPDGHRSNGLLIAGAAGAEVRAVSAGRVAYADWLKGYGLLLIVDHGNGLMSLYAYNDTLLKAVGDAVRPGEAVATVGTSGGQARPALYFELRRGGQPVDPAGFLRR
jgi:septal ring factor EnvC (AmiA/AmiB activator)